MAYDKQIWHTHICHTHTHSLHNSSAYFLGELSSKARVAACDHDRQSGGVTLRGGACLRFVGGLLTELADSCADGIKCGDWKVDEEHEGGSNEAAE